MGKQSSLQSHVQIAKSLPVHVLWQCLNHSSCFSEEAYPEPNTTLKAIFDDLYGAMNNSDVTSLKPLFRDLNVFLSYSNAVSFF